MSSDAHVTINGGGLVGALAAIYLLQHTKNVTVFEKRSDIRCATAETGRSINLIITSRGLFALRNIGLEEEALKLCVPVKGRMMHDTKGETVFQPYGVNPSEVNYSVSRTQLNALLIDIAEKKGAKFHFCKALENVDWAPAATNGEGITMTYGEVNPENGAPVDGTKVEHHSDWAIGTDGVASAARTAMLAQLVADGVTDAEFHPEHLGISYKELTFPKGADGGYCMDGDALHIWPRGPHFLMGLADKLSTFTGTLYLPDGTAKLEIPGVEKVPSFEQLAQDPAKYEQYVLEQYPDIPKLVPDYKEQLSTRPHSFLATVRCTHWCYKNKMVLLGDAGHGVVPFFGQGMNLGFESVAILDRFLRQHGGAAPAQLATAFEQFTSYHKASATAIANMAIENFTEMSYKVGQPEFLKRKAVENYIESQHLALLRSRYYLVTKTLVPYKLVQEAGAHIDACVSAVIDDMARDGVEDVKDFSAEKVIAHIKTHLTPFIEEHGIVLDAPLKEYYPSASA